jgi:hypothetical protein
LVTVPKDGLHNRYRMHTNLDEIARDPRVSSVDLFRGLAQTTVESRIGPTPTPNFYYRISTARLVTLARSRRARPSATVVSSNTHRTDRQAEQ